jgi:hypothetical protein
MRTIPKGVLLSGEPLDVADLSLRHRIALMAAGWTQGSSLASFLNFSGESFASLTLSDTPICFELLCSRTQLH